MGDYDPRVDVPSKSQVKRAGSIMRRCMRGDIDDHEQFKAAAGVMDAWRRAHYLPLVTATNGLRSMARTARVEANISQRLKRRQTILEKLLREPTLDLSRMQDFGGCRAVVKTIPDLRRLEARLKKNRPPVGYADYIESPRSSGYRGVHVIVEYQDRQIEVQLRTTWMHEWALAAEHFSGVLGENLKRDGSHPIQLFLAAASDLIHLRAVGDPIPEDLQALYEQRRLAASPTLPR